MADVFVGYKREDLERVRVLVKALEAQGWSVWWDTRAEAGEAWDPVVEAEVRAAECVIVVWSRQSIGAESVRRSARSTFSRLVSVVIDDVSLPEFLPPHPSVDLSGWEGDPSDARFSRVVAGVRRSHARRHNNRGLGHYNREEYDLAIAECSKAIELDPSCVEAYQTRALSYFEKKDHDLVIADCSKAIEVASQVGMPAWFYYNFRGIAYLCKKDDDRAIAEFDKALDLFPELDSAHYGRGLVYDRKGEHERATGEFTKAIELWQQAAKWRGKIPFRYYLGRARAYENRGLREDKARAEADYRKVLEISPSNADAKDALARLGEAP